MRKVHTQAIFTDGPSAALLRISSTRKRFELLAPLEPRSKDMTTRRLIGTSFDPPSCARGKIASGEFLKAANGSATGRSYLRNACKIRC